MQEGASLTHPSGFNGKGYVYWKERMKIFIKGVDMEVWDSIDNGPFIPTHFANGVLTNKDKSEWTDEEKKRVQYNLCSKNIVTSALGGH